MNKKKLVLHLDLLYLANALILIPIFMYIWRRPDIIHPWWLIWLIRGFLIWLLTFISGAVISYGSKKDAELARHQSRLRLRFLRYECLYVLIVIICLGYAVSSVYVVFASAAASLFFLWLWHREISRLLSTLTFMEAREGGKC